jgi:predicted ATP-grasp superfamily ATP-dependent carboligase
VLKLPVRNEIVSRHRALTKSFRSAASTFQHCFFGDLWEGTFFMNLHPAVITPFDYHMGVDIARSLGRRGIPVFGIDPDRRQPGRTTRFSHFNICPDPRKSKDAYVDYLINFGRRLEKKAVLFAVRDDEVMIISEARSQLKDYYEIVMPDHATVAKLLTKDGLRQAAVECGIPAPRTVYPHNEGELAAAVDEMEFPLILKPTESLYWHTPEIVKLLSEGTVSGKAKVVLCRSKDELLANYRKIAAFDHRMIVQEAIPGEDRQLVYFASYTNRWSETIASFAGRKIRVIPAGFGSASYVKTFHDPALYELSLKLLSGVKYQGLSGIEFKQDPRDNVYKLVEVNARFGLWDGLSTKIGVDLPWVAYQDAFGQPVEARHTYPEGVIWVDYYRDLRAFLTYRRMGKITFGEWMRSLRGEKVVGTFAWDDPLPLLSTGLNLASRLVSDVLH